MTHTLVRPRRDARPNRSSLMLLAIVPFLVAAGGCSGTASVKGKAIQGEVSFMGVGDAGDERLKAAGLKEVEVNITSDPGRSSATTTLGHATTDATGNFSIRITDQSSYSRQAGFSARKEGYISTTGLMPLPPADLRLLIILQPAGRPTSAPAAAPPPAAQRTK